jgi:hypothetical protein
MIQFSKKKQNCVTAYIKNCQFSRPTGNFMERSPFRKLTVAHLSTRLSAFSGHVKISALYSKRNLINFFTKIQLLVSILSALIPATTNYFNNVLNIILQPVRRSLPKWTLPVWVSCSIRVCSPWVFPVSPMLSTSFNPSLKHFISKLMHTT